MTDDTYLLRTWSTLNYFTALCAAGFLKHNTLVGLNFVDGFDLCRTKLPPTILNYNTNDILLVQSQPTYQATKQLTNSTN